MKLMIPEGQDPRQIEKALPFPVEMERRKDLLNSAILLLKPWEEEEVYWDAIAKVAQVLRGLGLWVTLEVEETGYGL